MIWFFKPYSLEKDIGKAYNEYCSLVPDGDWICLLDGDTLFLTSDYGHICQKYINAFPECQFFFPYVSRVGKRAQCYNRTISSNPDITYHKKIADSIKTKIKVKDINRHEPFLRISMPMFLFSKKIWKEVGGFDETQRILGVDIRFSDKVRKHTKVYRMEGFYLLHYYRLLEGVQNKDHLL
jgi:GT2 family glycosyltransferase